MQALRSDDGERQFCSLMSWTEQTNRLRLFCWSCYPKTRFRFLRSARCGQRNPAGDYHRKSDQKFHDALKRRCLYTESIFQRLNVSWKLCKRCEVDEQLGRLLVNFVQRLREEDLFKLPGIAETLDWADALVQLDQIA